VLGLPDDHHVPSFQVDGDRAAVVDELNLTGAQSQEVGFVLSIHVPRTHAFELSTRRRWFHGGNSTLVSLALGKCEREEFFGDVVVVRRMELDTELSKSIVSVGGRDLGHARRMPVSPAAISDSVNLFRHQKRSAST
jgi:hypothetical protein